MTVERKRGGTLFDLNMLTSPKRSMTRSTSRRSANVRGEGWSFRNTVRALKEAIVVRVIVESLLCAGERHVEETEVAVGGKFTVACLCRVRGFELRLGLG